ncbi:hypothetical protein EGW08_015477, partial [Elysia chlorotica]
MEAVDHLELAPEILLGEVVQHARIHQALHEVAPVLGQPQRWQPVLADPLMIHVAERQRLVEEKLILGRTDHLLDSQSQLEPVQRVRDADLPLDLRIRQGRHYGTAFHIRSARGYVPGWHAYPQL